MNKTRTSAFGFIILMLTAVVWAAPVPDTGQSKCFNNTEEILCPSPGQPFYGQDANYSINPMSYTKLDGSGSALPDSAAFWVMVLDNVTGLIWEVKTVDGTIHDRDRTYTWYDPAYPYPNSQDNGTNTKYFTDAMNIAQFGGYSDWRMPTIKELGTIIDYNINGTEPAVNNFFFPNAPRASFYWSSTPFVYYSYSAWGVDSYYGFDNYRYKGSASQVRVVRGEKSGSSGNLKNGTSDAVKNGSLDDASTAAGGYKDNGDGTVTDTYTNLVWQQAVSPNEMTWEQALAYSEGLNLGSHTDWRLPTKKELRSLVDFSRYNPSINTTYFPDTISSFYWSSTSDVFNNDSAWGAYFYFGDDGYVDKLRLYNVRAVRGGQASMPTGCTATVDKNSLLHIPYLSYVNSLLGTLSLWADFVYELNPAYPALVLFKLTNAAMIPNYSYLCSASTLSDDYRLYIPDVLFPDGSTHLWMELEFSPAFSTDKNTYFIVTNYGVVSN